jgi:chaperonin GroES
MTRSVQPLNDRVLVKRMLAEEKTAGGILIPDNAKEKPVEGKVIAVGEGKILDDGSRKTMEVKTGDKILFGKWGGTEIKLDGEEHLLIREDEILAVLN